MRVRPTKTGSVLVLALLALALALPAHAQQRTVVTLQASDLSVPLGDSLQLSVSVSGSADGEPTLSGLKNFRVQGTSSGSSVQIINGSITVSHSYSYRLVAVSPGSNDVTAVVRAGNGRVSSNTLHLTVLPAGASPAQPPPTAPPDDSGKPVTDGAGGIKPIFMRTTVKPTSTVVGGPIIVEYYIYVRDDLNPRQYRIAEAPQFAGFVATELSASNTLTFVNTRVGNGTFNVAMVRRFALFPVAAGPATIGPLVLSIDLPRTRRRGSSFDPFQDFDEFFGGQQRVEVRPDPVTVQVTPVPTAGRPSDWNGAVGDWMIEGALDRTEIPVGEPIELRLKVTGVGNVDTVERPPLALGENLRVYSQSDKSNVVPGIDNISAERTFSVMLIASAPGDYKIPPVRLSFYDPNRKAYRAVETAALSFKATGAAQANQPHSLGLVSRESVELRGRDLRYIRGNHASLRTRSAPLAGSVVLWIALGLWPVVVVGVVLYQARLGRLRSDRGTWRSRRALKEAHRRLAEVKKLLPAADAAQYYSELHRALLNFVADKLDAAAPGLSPEELTALLQSRGVDNTTIDTLFGLWRSADEVRFAGRAADAAERQAAYDRARDLLADLSRDLEH